MSFWKELKRRNVYKVGVAYAIVAWLLIQAASIIFPHLSLPTWAVTLVIVLLIIGFPLALLLAWAYEVTPDGIKRTKHVPLSESIRHLTGQKLNYIVTGLLVLAVAFLVIDNYLIDRHAIEPEMVSTETAQVPAIDDAEKTQKTIAVIPFVNLSSDPEQEYFVDGLSEELLNSLCQIPDLLVTARTSSFTFKGSDKTVQEIASVLGVENILEGSVRKAENALRITAQLVRATDGFHLWSKTYDRELKDIFAVQEDIANAVAGELSESLGIDTSLRQLGGTNNDKAYELYLIAKAAVHDNINSGLESIDAAINLDPKFALAWAKKAGIHHSRIVFLPADKIASELDAGLRAVQKAIELEPNLVDTYFNLGQLRSDMGDWIEAETAFRKARELITEPSLRYQAEYPLLYLSVGHFERAKEVFEASLRNDPLAPRSHYLLCLSLIGDMEKAEEQYKLSRALLGDDWMLNGVITLGRLGSGGVVSRDDIIYSDPIFDAAKEHLDSPKEGLAKLHQFYSDNNRGPLDLYNISLWAAYFGDPEFSMDSLEKSVTLSVGNMLWSWFPVMHDVRQLPRFKEFVKEVGLVDYWNKFGWPDICYKLDNGDFECD